MIMNHFIETGLIVLMSSLLLFIAEPALGSDVDARLSLTPNASGLRVEAFCVAREDGPLRYELQAFKTGRAGNSKVSQEGRVYLTAGEEKSLSLLKLGISAEDAYTIHLRVYRDGTQVAEATVRRDMNP